eukprot:352824-Chlamydomonas_euryale.AAC.4
MADDACSGRAHGHRCLRMNHRHPKPWAPLPHAPRRERMLPAHDQWWRHAALQRPTHLEKHARRDTQALTHLSRCTTPRRGFNSLRRAWPPCLRQDARTAYVYVCRRVSTFGLGGCGWFPRATPSSKDVRCHCGTPLSRRLHGAPKERQRAVKERRTERRRGARCRGASCCRSGALPRVSVALSGRSQPQTTPEQLRGGGESVGGTVAEFVSARFLLHALRALTWVLANKQ